MHSGSAAYKAKLQGINIPTQSVGTRRNQKEH